MKTILNFVLLLWRMIFPKRESFAMRMAKVEKTIVPEELNDHEIRLVKKKPRILSTRRSQIPGKILYRVITQPSRGDDYRSKFRKLRRKKVELVRIISFIGKEPRSFSYRIAAV